MQPIGFAGFHSKDGILELAYASGRGTGAFWVGILAALLTSFYSWRLMFLTFWGKPRWAQSEHIQHSLHEGDLIVVDFGTASTFDWIDYRGAYKGGIIAPGINLSLDALVNAAAKLPRIAIEAPADPSVIGRDTVSQMNIGIYWGYIAMIEGLVTRMKAEIGRPSKVIATGGLAVLFEKNTGIFDVIESDLTIQGLAMMWERAQEK